MSTTLLLVAYLFFLSPLSHSAVYFFQISKFTNTSFLYQETAASTSYYKEFIHSLITSLQKNVHCNNDLQGSCEPGKEK